MQLFRLTALLLLLAKGASATTWRVGPSRTYTNCSQVAALVQNGDTVLIDKAVYKDHPQILWTRNNLYLAGTGGRPRLEAGSTIANDMVNGKGIFVISGQQVKVENIEFANAVVKDHNGAGIRQEGANLHITRCRFVGNEMGILGGNIPNCKTTIEYCEFVNGGSTANPGYQHNIYINHIDTFVFRYNYTHDAIAEGHELKSRASWNFILYNRIANETTVDSRTIDLPNGGTSVLLGNIIEQGPASANSNLVGYGLEGLSNPAPHQLWVVNNTFVNKKSTGSFINVAAGTDTLFVRNNIFAGARTAGIVLGTPKTLDSAGNAAHESVNALGFVNPAAYDYHLQKSSAAIDRGLPIGNAVKGYSLKPALMYRDTSNWEPRPAAGVIDAGAFEYSSPTGLDDPALPVLAVYPNPCSDRLFVEVDEPAFYTVADLWGAVKLRGWCDAAGISTGALPAGLYVLICGGRQCLFIRQ